MLIIWCNVLIIWCNVLQMLIALRTQVSLISEIDTTIFRPTVWNSDVQEGFGLDIGRVSSSSSFVQCAQHSHINSHTLFPIPQIMIHSDPGSMDCNQQVDTCYYSRELDNRNPEASDLLTAFNFGNWNGYCLAHLFTHRDFTSGLLGLANIASPLQGQTGGVCSRGKYWCQWSFVCLPTELYIQLLMAVMSCVLFSFPLCLHLLTSLYWPQCKTSCKCCEASL